MKPSTRYHSRWRIDSAYKSKLSPQELAWLEKFESEYYRAIISDDPFHTPQQQKDLYKAQNSAWADIVTQAGDRVTDSASKKAGPSRHTTYTPSDYSSESTNPEDDIINAIDAGTKSDKGRAYH